MTASLDLLVLGNAIAAILMRHTRSAMLTALDQDYVRTARAKGLMEVRVVIRHAFRNALVGIIPVIGLQAGFVLGGAVYVETVFQWPGMGLLLVQSIQVADIPVMSAYLLLIAVVFMAINLLVDLLYYAVDPRLRMGKARA